MIISKKSIEQGKRLPKLTNLDWARLVAKRGNRRGISR